MREEADPAVAGSGHNCQGLAIEARREEPLREANLGRLVFRKARSTQHDTGGSTSKEREGEREREREAERTAEASRAGAEEEQSRSKSRSKSRSRDRIRDRSRSRAEHGLSKRLTGNCSRDCTPCDTESCMLHGAKHETAPPQGKGRRCVAAQSCGQRDR